MPRRIINVELKALSTSFWAVPAFMRVEPAIGSGPVSTTTDTSTCAADLHLTKIASGPIVQIGFNFTYTLDVVNGGPLDATNVVITDQLPDNAPLVSAQITAGSGNCANTGQLLTCTFPTVATANPTLTLAALCLRTADHILKKVL